MDTDDVAVGRRIVAARKLKKIKNTQELARLIDTPGLGDQTIGAIERGRRQLRSHEAILFADVLDVTVDYLYTGEQPPAKPSPDLLAIEARLAAIEQHLAAADKSISGQLGKQDLILEDIHGAVADIRALVEPLRGVKLEVTGQAEAEKHPPGPAAEGEIGRTLQGEPPSSAKTGDPGGQARGRRRKRASSEPR